MEERYLIEGLQNRDKIVFDFIFQYYYSGLCAYTETIAKNEKVAEDIVQDLFVSLWVKSDRIKITSSLKDYLFSAVKNRAFDFLKHEKMKSGKMQVLTGLSGTNEDGTELWFTESELEALIQKSLEKLSPRCREIFEMSRFQGQKNQDIAEKLGISKRTVELQISNALKVLRKDLKPFLPLFLIMLLLK